MRLSLNFNLRPFAAYLVAIILAALCWQDATSVYAGNAPAPTALPPIPGQNPFLKRQPAIKGHVAARRPQHTNRPSNKLGLADEIATLHAVQTALSSVGDGGAYVWQRGNGLLTGLIRPTTSFKSSNGDICRHIIIRLDSMRYSREVEGIACRDPSGTWSLAG